MGDCLLALGRGTGHHLDDEQGRDDFPALDENGQAVDPLSDGGDCALMQSNEMEPHHYGFD
jgi:hypothetical protein